MKTNVIPRYHPSYTEEENYFLYEYIESSTNENLVEDIFRLCALFSDSTRERVLNALYQFGREISEREYFRNCYNELTQCKELWRGYRNALERYSDILEVRQVYQNYRNEPGDLREEETHFNAFTRKYRDTFNYSPETLRIFLLSEKSKKGIKQPIPPTIFYETLDDFKKKQYSSKEALSFLHREELEYILIILLNYADSTNERNCADVILSFLTRKYSFTSHKKTPSIFSTNTLSYIKLKNNCFSLLSEIEKLRKETKLLEQNI